MEQSGKTLWNEQNARLGSFLIASSFLVAAFIQLVTSGEQLNILVHSVAFLGSFIAALYTFMNFWLSMPNWLTTIFPGAKSTSEQVLHTWLIPLVFLIFWLVAWINSTGFWWSILIIGIILLICLVFQICRTRKI